jgi:RecG-like helicase
MKRTSLILAGIAGLLLVALATPTFAAKGEKRDKGKEITLAGEAKCAKCMLKQTDKCQTAIQVDKKAKTRTYCFADNDVAKAFHENVCKEGKKVTVTGKLEKVDGKKGIAATKIELVK